MGAPGCARPMAAQAPPLAPPRQAEAGPAEGGGCDAVDTGRALGVRLPRDCPSTPKGMNQPKGTHTHTAGMR